ncbi:MAG: G1 family glutamic endopeptidase [Acidimicrobiales bacterium]
MNLPKGAAARIAAGVGLAALCGTWGGVVPAGASAPHEPHEPLSAVSSAGTGVPKRIHRGPDPLVRVPASVTLPASTAAPPAAPVPPSGRAPGVTHGLAARHATADTGTFNWSGEFAAGSAITSISGTWTVPAVQPSATVAMVSTWVGIGGMSTTAPLIQAGTISAETTDGSTGYAAWYEMLPLQSYTVTTPATTGGTAAFTVQPGDVVTVSLTNVEGNDWDVAIEDQTSGWRYEHAFSYASTESSAEWITERPSYVDGNQYSLYTLPDYGVSRFTHLGVAKAHGTTTAPAGLGAFAMYDTTGAVISAPGAVSATTGTSFTDHYVKVPDRVSGATAAATAAAELVSAFPDATGDCPGPSSTTRAVVLATDATFPDALASAYLASSLGTGTLLTGSTSLPATTLDTIRDEGITHVYVVGGTLAVSQAVAEQLETTDAYACGGASVLPGTQKLQVSRIGGATAYDTAAMIAKTPSASDVGSADLADAYAGTNSSGGAGAYNVTAGNASAGASSASAVPTAVLATGTTFQDAESASTLAYAARFPILLTTPASLSSQASATITALGIEQVVVMGGPYAVSDAAVDALEADGVSVLRVAGVDGTQTAVELAESELASSSTHLGFGWPATGGIAVARGNFYSDGLAGAVVAAGGAGGASPEPLLLTEDPTTVGPYLGTFLQELGTTGVDGKTVTHLTIFGGVEAVTLDEANTLSLDLLG